MRNLTIGKKIGLGFATIITLLGITTIVSFYETGTIAQLAGVAQRGIQDDAFLVQKEVDHLNWSASLTDSIINKKEISIQTNPHKCGFGKWLYGAIDENKYDHNIMAVLKEIEPVHKRLHQSAIEIKQNHSTFDSSIRNVVAQRWIDHLMWIKGLQEMLITGKKFNGQLNPSKCGFGKWMEKFQSSDETLNKLLSDWHDPHKQLHDSAHKVISLWKKGKKEAARKTFNSTSTKYLNNLRTKYLSTISYIDRHSKKTIKQQEIFQQKTLPALKATQSKLKNLRKIFHDTMIKVAGDASKDLAGTAAFAKTFILIFGAVATIVGIIMAIFISRSIIVPISKATESLTSITQNVTSAAAQLSNASQELSSSSGEQAASLEETSSSLEEISGMIKNNVTNAEEAYELSNKVKTISEESNQSMESLKDSMSDILASNERIEKLVNVISNIGDKTQVMDEIVFQTKLLSFNASVEAERAGEHGRGFAVVAQEVGNLAQMSGQAAQEIAVIVKESINEAESITTENRQKVELGSNQVAETADRLKEIMQVSQTVTDGSKQVLDASKDQSEGIGQINIAITQVDKATQENAATAEETASSSEELNSQSEVLARVVSSLASLIKKEDRPESTVHQTPRIQVKKVQAASKPVNTPTKVAVEINNSDQDTWDSI